MLEALRHAPSLGWEAVFLLGDPAYYARFGFRAAAPPFTFGDPAADPALQLLELRPGVLAGQSGRVRYHPAFVEDV
jgi:putative acetyltransferase